MNSLVMMVISSIVANVLELEKSFVAMVVRTFSIQNVYPLVRAEPARRMTTILGSAINVGRMVVRMGVPRVLLRRNQGKLRNAAQSVSVRRPRLTLAYPALPEIARTTFIICVLLMMVSLMTRGRCAQPAKLPAVTVCQGS